MDAENTSAGIASSERTSSAQLPRTERWMSFLSAGLTAAALIYLIASLGEPLRSNWGDPWSDANVQNSGKNFVKEGFFRQAFTPTLDLEPLSPRSLRYTHYPPLPDILNGVEQLLFGARDIAFYRSIALGMTVAGMAYFFFYVRRVWGPQVARFALPLFVTNLMFLQYADCIHHIPIYWMAGFGALFAATRWLDGKSAWSLLATGAGLFIALMASYDYYFFLPLMLVFTPLVLGLSHRHPRARQLVLATFAGGAAAVLVKSLLVIWAIGLSGFVRDVTFQFFERATAQHASAYEGGLLTIAVGRLWRMFGPLLVISVGTQLVGVIDYLRKRTPLVVPSPLVLLVAALPFLFVFTQLFCEQHHPMLLLLPYFSVGGGALLARLLSRREPSYRMLAVAAFAGAVTWHVVELVRLEKTFVTREDVATVRRVLERDNHNFILTNPPTDAFVRAYWNRYPEGIPGGRATARQLRELFETRGGDTPLTIVEFVDWDASIYDKWIYPVYADEKRWEIIANPFAHRREWRARMVKSREEIERSYRGLGTVEYQSRTMRVRMVTEAQLDKYQREQIPEEETVAIDFESYFSERFKVAGFGLPEQYEHYHGFSWLRQRQPIDLLFTLKGLRPLDRGAPIRTSILRVRLRPNRDYRVRALEYTAAKGQRLTLQVNGGGKAETILADCSTTSPKEIEFRIRRERLNADGVQDLAFSYSQVGADGNALLFHSISFEPLESGVGSGDAHTSAVFAPER
jgi:hypothetical protein